MAGEKIRVNTVSLNRTRGELQERLNQLNHAIDEINNDMSTLNSMWEGEAHAAFIQSVNEDLQFLTEICSVIQSIIGYEETAVTEYDRCERQVADIISQIRI